MIYHHAMPFGAEILENGGTRFRLWAPALKRLTLIVDGDDEHAMTPVGDGWFEYDHPTAGAGTRYQYRLPDGLLVPDPASRSNPDDVHGPSEVINPRAFDWTDTQWLGRAWEEAVMYELHVGTFSPYGTFDGVTRRLDYLAELGVTALEIMPVAEFPGRRNWGYDGTLLFAPDSAYGRPEDFKRLIEAAHQRGLMVILDVVYNHFGPDGNYLHAYAPDFFTDRHSTPWGAAINFDGENSRPVRDFFVHNALYWLNEYHLDGLRLDAIHAICDDSSPNIVEEIATAIRRGPGSARQIHLILENDRNQARYLERDAQHQPVLATAQWNDDVHHALHVIASGERDGYYAEYADESKASDETPGANSAGHDSSDTGDRPLRVLARCLSEGFAYQGEVSTFRDGEVRGEPSAHLPPGAFIDFLQTHDQIGNRAFGERLCHLAGPDAMEAVTMVLLLAPATPFIFMGEEFASDSPFLFFCDFGGDLAASVTEGRRREFACFERFADPAVRQKIPDPCASTTFANSVLDWSVFSQPKHLRAFDVHRRLLALRREWIVPRLAGMGNGRPEVRYFGKRGLTIRWRLADGSQLQLTANLGETPCVVTPVTPASGRLLVASSGLDDAALAEGRFPPWSVAWNLLAGESQ